MWHVPSQPPTVSRRRVLTGAAGLALLSATALTSAGCSTPPPPPDLDDLTTALDRARADSTLATDAAADARGATADTLTDIAAQRAAHAEALSDEIIRMTGQPAPTTSVTVTTATSAAANTPAPAPPTAKDVVGALRSSADSAASAAATLSGYRAGLLASIAASCTAAYTVGLDPAAGAR